jgi:Glycine zipper 2TM domain
MRTLILLGLAASATVMAERAAAADVPLTQGVSIADTLVAAGHKKKKDTPLDYGVGYPSDARVYSGGADRYPVEGEYRRVEDTDYQGRWTGTWDGTYEAPDGRTYEGQYRGTYEGDAGTTYAPPPPASGHHDRARHGGNHRGGPDYGFDPREDARLARVCNEQGLGGSAIGAVAGGIAGNRIAGRGNRLGGTLIGAGVGGIIGNVIDRGEDRARCKAWRSWRHSQTQSNHGGGYYPGGYPGGHATPYPGTPHVTTQHHGGGYGYYSPGVVVTTIITPAAPVTETVTTTTTTTRYETVYVNRARHAPKKRHYKPRPKPRCGC